MGMLEIQEDSGTDARAISYPILSVYLVDGESLPEQGSGKSHLVGVSPTYRRLSEDYRSIGSQTEVNE